MDYNDTNDPSAGTTRCPTCAVATESFEEEKAQYLSIEHRSAVDAFDQALYYGTKRLKRWGDGEGLSG